MKDERLLRLPSVRERTGLSRSGVYRAVQKGELAAPVKISARASAWPSTVVDRFVKSKISAAVARADGQPTEKSKP